MHARSVGPRRWGMWLCLILLACATQSHSAMVARHDLNQRVDVLCVRFPDADGGDPGRTCSAWVDALNQMVGEWYEINSHGVTSFAFRLPSLHAGQALPPGGWIPATRKLSDVGGFYVEKVRDTDLVLPVVDPIVDFSQIDRLVIISKGISFFGQANPGGAPGSPYLGNVCLPVAEHNNEEQWMRPDGTPSWCRRVAVLLLSEGRFFDPNKAVDFADPVTGRIEAETGAIHELSHWLGLPDRYGSYVSVPQPRLIADWYSMMGLTHWDFGIAHWLGEERVELGFNYNGRSPLSLTVPSSGRFHVIPGFIPSNDPDEPLSDSSSPAGQRAVSGLYH